MGQYDYCIITDPEVFDGKTLTYHVDGAGPYMEMLSAKVIPESKLYMSLWTIQGIPRGNPPCTIHSHEVEQYVIYIGEPETFEVLYNIVPPGVQLDNEYMAPREHQYRIRRTGGFYIPKGVRHNNYIVRCDKPPIYEVCIMAQAGYDEKK